MKLKGITLLILLLNLTQINGQNVKIEGVQKYCQNDNTDWRERYIKLKKGTEVIRDSIDNKRGNFVIKNLPKGNYFIEFTNIFGQKIQKNILANKEQTEIEICVDDFKDTGEETFLQKLTTENKLQFNFISKGCFHLETEKIIFFQIGEDFFAKFTNSEIFSTTKKLNQQQLQYLITFERKLRQMKDNMGGCTTEDSYHLILGKEELKIVDGSCDWSGYYEMKNEIFNLK